MPSCLIVSPGMATLITKDDVANLDQMKANAVPENINIPFDAHGPLDIVDEVTGIPSEAPVVVKESLAVV